jgi:hypothetical protein
VSFVLGKVAKAQPARGNPLLLTTLHPIVLPDVITRCQCRPEAAVTDSEYHVFVAGRASSSAALPPAGPTAVLLIEISS